MNELAALAAHYNKTHQVESLFAQLENIIQEGKMASSSVVLFGATPLLTRSNDVTKQYCQQLYAAAQAKSAQTGTNKDMWCYTYTYIYINVHKHVCWELEHVSFCCVAVWMSGSQSCQFPLVNFVYYLHISSLLRTLTDT